MLNSLEKLGELVKAHRELRGDTQDQLVTKVKDRGSNANRSVLAHLEQGIRVPKPDILRSICETLEIPPSYWQPFTNPDSLQRLAFEEVLSELIGAAAMLDGHDEPARAVAERQIAELFEQAGSGTQTLDRLNSVLVFYGVPRVSEEFFGRYLGSNAFASVAAFGEAVKTYQKDAVRLFSTIGQAFAEFNQSGKLSALLAPLQVHDIANYTERTEWAAIETIEDDRLADLGYISATRVKQESKERETLRAFLEALARDMRTMGKSAIDNISTKAKKRMDSLLRKFDSKIPHGLFSPLFAPDPDELQREATRIAPKTEQEIARMQATQETALRNLARYLSADHMDVYVATSMRSDADFVSVNYFVRALFLHEKVRNLKLRFFNPTQSWIDDRIAKGLVEALMLRRASITIYMAQKIDTFGKDSEASVALGQGKPVIVYVPKLVIPDSGIDAEALYRKSRPELLELLDSADQQDIDDAVDDQVIVSRILQSRLLLSSDEDLSALIRQAWADFDLHNEAERIEDPNQKADVTQALRAEYRAWLDSALAGKAYAGEFGRIRAQVIGILVANAIRFEVRARQFREIHPLALQVILSSGVLNGIIVVRSVQQCAEMLSALIANSLQLDLRSDEQNYRLIERTTESTIRVISRHRLLRHAFSTFYGRF